MASENIKLRVERRGEVTIVWVSGVLDALALSEVSGVLSDAQDTSGQVFVDLAEVTFMDSRGLGSLLAANARALDGAAAVHIHRPSPAVARLLNVSGVRDVLVEVDALP